MYFSIVLALFSATMQAQLFLDEGPLSSQDVNISISASPFFVGGSAPASDVRSVPEKYWQAPALVKWRQS